MSLIVCNDLALAYENRIVLDKVNFSVEEGDYLCIVGENGSGKSTLVKAILRQKAPAQGNIEFDNELELNTVGYLPQQTTANRDFPASVFEVVISGCLGQLKKRFFFSSKEKKLALENMEKLGISNLKNAYFQDLSGGQKQRVLLARALCATKKIILLDEPVAGLDPLATTEMYNTIKELNEKSGIAIVMVSHDILSAVKYAKHILHLRNTQLFYGTTEEYINSDIGKTFLGGAVTK